MNSMEEELREAIDSKRRFEQRLAALEARTAQPHVRLEALEKAVNEIRAQMRILMFGKRHGGGDGEGGEDRGGGFEAGR